MIIASLNLRAYPNRHDPGDLPTLIAGMEPDLVLLQECRRRWLDLVCDEAGLVGVHSHDVGPAMADWPPDGTAIAVRPPACVGAAWRIAPGAFQPRTVRRGIPERTPAGYTKMPPNLACRFSARTLLLRLEIGGRRFIAGSFHATPGMAHIRKGLGRVHEYKPFFHGAVALELAGLEEPYVFGIDANEPRSETVDDVEFHWADERPGVEKLKALLGLEPLHAAGDLLREQIPPAGEPVASGPLAVTYDTHGKDGKRRFDSIWATPDFRLEHMRTHYDEALSAGGDHALLTAEVALGA